MEDLKLTKRMFSLGQIGTTRGIWNWMIRDSKFCREVGDVIQRHASCDWGDLCEEDKQMNDLALFNNGRLLSAYDTSQGKIWIITEWDRSVTTILFPNEY